MFVPVQVGLILALFLPYDPSKGLAQAYEIGVVDVIGLKLEDETI